MDPLPSVMKPKVADGPPPLRNENRSRRKGAPKEIRKFFKDANFKQDVMCYNDMRNTLPQAGS